MEACMVKPEAKKKPKPPKPHPRSVEARINEIESSLLEKPSPVERPAQVQRPIPVERKTPLIPPRPTSAVNGNVLQEPKEKMTPVVPPRPTEQELKSPRQHSQRRKEQTPDAQSSKEADQTTRAEGSKDEADFKQTNVLGLTGVFRKSQKDKPKTFTSYVAEGTEEESADLTRQAPKSGLKGVMKSLQFKTSPKVNRDPSPDPSSVKDDKSTEKKKNDTEVKLGKKELSASSDSLSEQKEKGRIFSGMFKKSPKTAETSQNDEAESSEENPSENNKNKDKEKGGVFSGMFKKPPKPQEQEPEEGEGLLNSELSASNDSLSENKEKGGLFSGLLKKTPKATAEWDLSEKKAISTSSDSLSEVPKTKEKGNAFTGMFKKSKPAVDANTEDEKQPLDDAVSTSSSETSEGSSKEKGGIFGGIFKKAPKATDEDQSDEEVLDKELSASSENLSEKKEKGGVFSGLLKKTPKPSTEMTETQDGDEKKELRSSTDDLSDNKEKNVFSNIFKRQKPVEEVEKKLSGDELSASNENLSENKQDKGVFSGLLKKTPKPPKDRAASPERENKEEMKEGDDGVTETTKDKGVFSGLLKKTPKTPKDRAASPERENKEEMKDGDDGVTETTKEKNKFTNLFKKPQKTAEGATADKENLLVDLSGSCENIFASAAPKEKKDKGGFTGLFKRSGSLDNIFDPEDNIFTGMFKKPGKNAEGKAADEDSLEDKTLSRSCENLSEGIKTKEKSGGFAGMFKKSPKPAPRSETNEQDPLSDAKFEFGSCDSIPDMVMEENISASNEDLLAKEKKSGFTGLFKRGPKTAEPEEDQPATGIGIKRRKTIKKKKRVVSFRIKKTLPRLPKLTGQGAEKMPIIEETVEMQELNSEQEPAVEVEQVEMAAYPTQENPTETEEEDDELLSWWRTVAGWAEWNETSNQEEDEEEVIEEAADRVYRAARLFVHLFNQRGASLQHRILELLALADANDMFHKKTTAAAVGGGVASVAGSIATITGLILAPFTFGASIIVTAVGIGVATAGSITSATANITDTVHANMDRKNMEKMIQGYQDEIEDIRKCLEFVQEGMDTLQEWDFEKYTESAAKKALNHNIKHVMKEGGRAGKALMINTDKLISTVQVLGAAGGVVKAAKALSVTTGVMSALFLALDVFFLAKDSHELRKGAKTKFAAKIREVCKDLQNGLLELNKVKTQLQKTMDGIEVEEYEEIKEVEEEVDDDLESDPVKLAELELELDLMEQKLDQKVEEEKKRKEEEERKKEEEKKKAEEEAMAAKEKLLEDTDDEDEKEGDSEIKKAKSDIKKLKSEKDIKKSDDEKSEGVYSVKESLKEFFKDPILKVTKKDKEMENKLTANKEKGEKEKSGKKSHKKEASLSGMEILDEGKEDEEQNLEKSKSKKDGEKTKKQAKPEDTQSESQKVQDIDKAVEEKLSIKQDVKANEQKVPGGDDSDKHAEKSRFKSLKDLWTVKQENAEDKHHSQSLKEPFKLKDTCEDEKVKSLRESWLAKEHEIRMEKLAIPREGNKVFQDDAKQDGKVKSPSLSSRWVESSKSHHSSSSSRSESDRSSFRSDRSKVEHRHEEKRESHRSHREVEERKEHLDSEGQGEEKQGGHFERADEAERGSRRSHRESGRDQRESGRSHGEGGRAHTERRRSHRESDNDRESGSGHKESRRGHRESGRSHREGEGHGESGRKYAESGRSHREGERESRRSHRESDRRREDGGSRPRSNAMLDDGLYI